MADKPAPAPKPAPRDPVTVIAAAMVPWCGGSDLRRAASEVLLALVAEGYTVVQAA